MGTGVRALISAAGREGLAAVGAGLTPRTGRWVVCVVAAAVWVLATGLPAAAQPAVRFAGSVQWMTASTMAVATDVGASIVVELSQADQSTYRGLRTGDRVFIDGTLSRDGRHVIARDIWRDDGRGTWTQSP
jgi:hypothetical protein